MTKSEPAIILAEYEEHTSEKELPNAIQTLQCILDIDEKLNDEISKSTNEIDNTLLLQLHLAGSNAQIYFSNLVSFLNNPEP
jgi:hypothetical protein